MRLIEIVVNSGHTDTISSIADQYQVTDIWLAAAPDDGRCAVRMLVDDEARQRVMDALQNALAGTDNARVIVLPVDTVLPRQEDADVPESAATREELYTQIARGARIDRNFLLLTLLSTVVATIGLLEDNVAVVIGAMVIAPLLGPNIALAFGSSLGDSRLMLDALKANATGIGVALVVALLIGATWPLLAGEGAALVSSSEVMARTHVGLDGVALALASGAAAVLSLSTGLSSTLVGVMVAVALLPPTATMGMMLGAGHLDLAAGAALLLAVNVVCVIVSAKVVFLARGVRPRTWYEREKARQSKVVYGAFWALLLVVLIIAMLARHGD